MIIIYAILLKFFIECNMKKIFSIILILKDRKEFRNTNFIKDIPGVVPGSKMISIKTVRVTNPLNP